MKKVTKTIFFFILHTLIVRHFHLFFFFFFFQFSFICEHACVSLVVYIFHFFCYHMCIYVHIQPNSLFFFKKNFFVFLFSYTYIYTYLCNSPSFIPLIAFPPYIKNSMQQAFYCLIDRSKPKGRSIDHPVKSQGRSVFPTFLHFSYLSSPIFEPPPHFLHFFSPNVHFKGIIIPLYLCICRFWLNLSMFNPCFGHMLRVYGFVPVFCCSN